MFTEILKRPGLTTKDQGLVGPGVVSRTLRHLTLGMKETVKEEASI